MKGQGETATRQADDETGRETIEYTPGRRAYCGSSNVNETLKVEKYAGETNPSLFLNFRLFHLRC